MTTTEHDTDVTEAFAVPGEGHIIDCIHPATGRSVYQDETLEQIRARYPGAERVLIADWIAAKAARQRTPITWDACTEEVYDRMLEVLPPASMRAGGFLVGEPSDHEADTGRPRYAAYRQWDSECFAASRPLTIPEFLAEMARRAE